MQRTSQQNKALHLMFHQLANLMNEHGWDMRKFLRDGIEIPWSDYNVKEFLWRPVMKAYIGKESTKDMTTTDIDKVFEVIVKAIGERCGLTLEWPSVETIINQQRIDEKS